MNKKDAKDAVTSGPWAEIDLSALCANYDMLSAAAPAAETAGVVKCNAYGVGMEPAAKALAKRSGCQTFFVAYPEEGAILRAALAGDAPDADIFVFHGPSPTTLGVFRDARLTPVINSAEQAGWWAQAFPSIPCALHADTGMNRLGLGLETLGDINALSGMNVSVFMSHLACGAEPDHEMNARQRDAFAEASALFPDARKSLAASAGVLMDASYHYDVTRPGIALYGASPFSEDERRIKSVITLKAPIIQIRDINPGDSVGYNATFTATKPARIATVSIGYGDGIPVGGSGRACAIVNGERAQIAGRVSMDLIGLDITSLAEPPKIGDAAAFLGPDIRIFEAASACGVNSYELLTGLGGRVDRRYL